MSDTVEVLKSDSDQPALLSRKPRLQPPRQGWADTRSELTQELPEAKINILSPGQSSNGGERSPASEPVGVLSPSSGALSPTVELQHSKSFDSSSISSKSSKRTSVSADMSSLIRQRVRQQARSLVDKKRGSVQLAKRLLRSQTLQSAELPYSPDDFEATDRQLESTLQIGAKYVDKEITAEAPDYIQHRFFQANPPTEKQEITGAMVAFTKPKSTVKQRAEFSTLLTIHKPVNNESIEDPVYRLDPQTFRTREGRDFRLILSRHGDRFASNEFGVHGLEPMITKKIERLAREEDEDFALVEYRHPEKWTDWLEHGAQHKKYFQFNIDLNHLEFEHHWLFAQEDVISRRLRNLHSMYVVMCEKLVGRLKEYADLKQRVEIEVVGEDEQTRINNTLILLRDQISELKNEMPKVATLMEATYEALKQVWQTSSLHSNNYRLEKFAGESIEDDSGQEFILHTYLLKHVHQKTTKPENEAEPKSPSRLVRSLSQRRNAQEQVQRLNEERLAAIEKCRIRVQIYFNDTLVCNTDEVPLSWDFTAQFTQVYNLKIYEQPEKVELIVSEKFDRNAWRELARIYVPFALGNEFEPQVLEPMEFASELAISSFRNSIGCGEVPRSPCLSGKLYCNAIWVESGGPSAIQKARQVDTNSNNFFLIPHETMLGLDSLQHTDARLEALYRRYKNRHYAKENTKRIGLHPNEIDHSLLVDEWQATELSMGVGGESNMDMFYELGQQYAISIRNNLMQTATYKRRTKSYQDIVREDSIPVLFNFLETLFITPDLSRKLKPMRNQQRAKAPLHTKHKVVINIQAATNLPEKVNGESTNIFVDVLFRKQRAQTVAVEGRYANWQETVVLEIERDNNLHFDVSNINDRFELRLYDRILSALDYDNRETNTIHEQVENRFLGQAIIPFSSVYALGKVDGAMSIQKPLFHSDYKNMEKHSQLKVLITTDPPLLPPQLHLNEGFVDGENAQMVNECAQWQRKCLARFPDRIYYAMVSDTNGKAVLTTNYLQGVAAPQLLRDCASMNAVKGCQLAAHIVSCIPLVTNPMVCLYSSNVWMTVDQILTIGCASVEEHGILLANWLLGLGYQASIVLGHSLPEGANAAYVLVEIDNSPSYLVNPCNGNRYQLDDTTCPLFQICTVITSNNVYGNVQPVAHCAQMEFNFSRRQHWEPLFTDKRSNFSSVHKSVVYTEVSEDLVMELRTSLEREIRVKFDQSRPFGIPQWNVLASRALREVLADLGANLVEPKDVHVRDKFNQLGIMYEFSALAFQRGYTTRSQLLNDVLNTQVHVNANPLAQFAFAVHIQPYFNNIVSCLLAIACLQPNN